MEQLQFNNLLDSISDQQCLCSRTWVLIVHNDFLQVEGYERHGNDVDLENLKRVFQTERHCRFAELVNCNRDQIIETLSSEERLIQLFHRDGDCDGCGLTPELLFLFVLSHGESGGTILTNHFKLKPAERSEFVLALESYKTSDVWNSLSNLQFLKSCTKLLFFASCRGFNPETKISSTESSASDTKTDIQPGWLTSRPNREDFIVFYATVETTYANRNELRGTWFVQSICSVLDTIIEDLDVLLFFTKVQLQVCQMTKNGCADVGQTPQLHFFCKNPFNVCASHCEIKRSRRIIQPVITNDADCSDCRPLLHLQDDVVAVVSDVKDAMGMNLINLLDDERALFYDWGQEHFNFSRGTALIFHDNLHLKHALKLANCFQDLGYKLKLSAAKNIQTDIASKSLKKQFANDGSLVVCILAQLLETDSGLAVHNGKDCVLLSAVVDGFSGSKCRQLSCKPKLFFFLDEGNKQDNGAQSQNTDAHQFTNEHAGVCAFIGVGGGSDGGLIESLCAILSSNELRSGKKGLQTALVELIRENTDKPLTDRTCFIKPQIISTLPVLVDFPPLKPVPFNKRRFLAISGIIFAALSIILFTSGFLSLTRTNADDMLDVQIESNCAINFLPSNTSSVEAFSLGPEEWNLLSQKCNKTWQTYTEEHAIVDLITSGNDSKAIVAELNIIKGKRIVKQKLKLVVLFAYQLSRLSQLCRFCLALNEEDLKKQCFADAYKKISASHHMEKVEVLGFWYYFLADQNNSSLRINSSNSVQAIIAPINTGIDADYYADVRTPFAPRFEQFLKLNEEIMIFFVPILVSNYYERGLQLTILLRNFEIPVHPLACIVIHELFLHFQMDRNLDTMGAAELRASSKRILENGNLTILDNSYGIILCKNVTKELMKHSLAQAQSLLASYDAGELEKVRNNKLAYTVVAEIIHSRYNKNNLASLVGLLWENSSIELGEFSCVGSLNLVKEMQQHFGHIASFPALQLFFILNNRKKLPNIRQELIERFVKKCKSAKFFAPDYVKRFIFGDMTCNCCLRWREEDCINATRVDLDAALADQSYYMGAEYYCEILFWNYILLSIQNVSKNIALNTSSVTQLRKMSNSVLDHLALEYVQKVVVPSFDFKISTNNVNSLQQWFESSEIYEYYLPLVIQSAYGRVNTSNTSNLIILKFDLIENPTLMCKTVHILFTAITKKSNLESLEAFSFWLFLESYLIPSTLNTSESSSAFSECTKVESSLRTHIETQLDYYLASWNDSKQIPKLLDWHGKYQFMSAWMLPKLVRHVYSHDETTQSASKLLDFFKYLISKLPQFKQSNFLCAGLNALTSSIIIGYMKVSKSKLKNDLYYTLRQERPEFMKGLRRRKHQLKLLGVQIELNNLCVTSYSKLSSGKFPIKPSWPMERIFFYKYSLNNTKK